MDKSNDWPSVLKNSGSKKRRRRPTLADKTRKLNTQGKTWTDATGSKTLLRGLLEARRAQELAEAVKRLRSSEKAEQEANDNRTS